jgi:hypothetical protein
MVVDIVVRGEAEGRYAAERAVVTLAAAFEDGLRHEVYDRAVGVQQVLATAVAELAEREVVTTWSSDRITISTYRPWLAEGKQAPPVHAARIGLSAEFVEFAELGAFIDHWAGREGVEISGVAWDVLEGSRRRYEADIRKAAVDDAVDKAQAYADAFGLGRVVPTRIADPGLLTPSGGGSVPYAVKFEAASDGGGGVQLTPDQIVIRVAVDAGFTAE